MSPVPRTVLDTNAVLSALVFTRGPAGRLRQAWQASQLLPLVSTATAQELMRVLAYPKFKLAAQTKANTLVDRDALDDPDLLFKTQGGGFQRLDKIFAGQLLQTLDAFNHSIWAQPA